MMGKKITTRHFIYGWFVLMSGFLLSQCYQSKEALQSETRPYLNLADSVKYVGMAVCQSCHTNVHQTFQHTGMGRSFDHATLSKSDATFGDHALVYDDQNDFYYFPYFQDSVMYIREFRLENDDTIHNRIEKVSYIVGSGQHTNSHIIDINGYIFQAPITYYTQDRKWDMAPGFDKNNTRFERLLATECITCHNHFPKFDVQSMNKYEEMPTGIECERCHGPGEVHAKEKLSGNIVDTSKYVDYSIVNPRDLPRDLQMDLCQRCHLQGVAVLKEDKTFFDFKPGMELSSVMNIFLPRYSNSHEKFIMASQADRLKQSDCYVQSEMTCITCHNPHVSIEATGKDQYNDACINCHASVASTSTCTASSEEQATMNNDCSGCHMPKSGSIDIPHVNITDHYISKSNTAISQKSVSDRKEPARFLGLKLLNADYAQPLEMAKGYLALYDKYTASPIMLDSAFYYLNLSKANIEDKFSTAVHYYFINKQYDQIIHWADKKPINEITDAWDAYRIGEAYFAHGNYRAAQQYYEKAVEILPKHLDFQEKLATAYFSLKKYEAAQRTFAFVLSENEKRPVALSNLGFLYAQQGRIAAGLKLIDEAIALDPDYEQALLNKAGILIAQQNIEDAKRVLLRILKKNPEQKEALSALKRLTVVQ